MKARQAGLKAQSYFERIAQCFRVKVEFLPERGQLPSLFRAAQVPRASGCIARNLGATARPAQCKIHLAADVRIGPVFDETLLDCLIEDFSGCAEVFANLVDLGCHIKQEVEIGIIVRGKVKDGDITGLAVAINAAIALLQAGGIPRNIEV